MIPVHLLRKITIKNDFIDHEEIDFCIGIINELCQWLSFFHDIDDLNLNWDTVLTSYEYWIWNSA